MRTQKHRVFRTAEKLGFTPEQTREFLCECGAPPTRTELPAQYVRDGEGKWTRDPSDYRDISPLLADLCINLITRGGFWIRCEDVNIFVFNPQTVIEATHACSGKGYCFPKMSKRERELYRQMLSIENIPEVSAVG